MFSLKKYCLAAVLILTALPALAFDHTYRDWNALLGKHVRVATDGHSSRVDYHGMATDKVLLNAYLESASACLLYTSPSPRDRTRSRMPSSA